MHDDLSGNAEVFSDTRMARCQNIAGQILENHARTGRFDYLVTTCDIPLMATIDYIRTLYFGVGVGPDVIEIPFHDLLVVFSLLEQHFIAMQKPQPGNEFEYAIATHFSNAEASRLLGQILIDTPSCKRIRLRAQAR